MASGERPAIDANVAMFMMSMQAKVSEPAAADDKILVVSKSDELAFLMSPP